MTRRKYLGGSTENEHLACFWRAYHLIFSGGNVLGLIPFPRSERFIAAFYFHIDIDIS